MPSHSAFFKKPGTKCQVTQHFSKNLTRNAKSLSIFQKTWHEMPSHSAFFKKAHMKCQVTQHFSKNLTRNAKSLSIFQKTWHEMPSHSAFFKKAHMKCQVTQLFSKKLARIAKSLSFFQKTWHEFESSTIDTGNMPMDTILLTRSELECLLSPGALLAALRSAFAAYSSGRAVDSMRIPVPLPAGEVPAGASGMLLAPGLIPGIPAYSVKVHAKFPGSNPAIRGVLILHDLSTGAPLAVMESSFLTALRTGLAGALGSDVLALPGARSVAIIGAGVQGRSQLSALRMVRPITSVRVLDSSRAAAELFANDQACAGLEIKLVDSIEQALDGVDIAITATWAREPFLFGRHLHPGLHITTLGPDQPGKCEVAADALRAALVVVDDRKLALEMGAVGGAGLAADSIHAELGEVIAGTRPGRRDDRQVTIFGSVGLAFQDLSAGWLAYTLATEQGVGRRLDLLA
jgi:ornithine cyclodeaminase/alanine dehydrogenase-like protein (mu-crystallin family)